MHALLHSVPPALQQATTDPRLTGDSWTLTGKSGSVSCGVTAALSWVLVHTRLCVCSPRVYFPVLCKFWQLYGGVNGDLLQEGLCHTQVCCIQCPCPCSRPPLAVPPQEMLRHSSVSISVAHINDPILKTYVQLILIIHGSSFQIFLLAKAHL